MGLHINAYSDCIKLDDNSEENYLGYPNIEYLEYRPQSSCDFDFSAGSYSGYNDFREKLAKFAGYPEIDYTDYFQRTVKSAAAYCWQIASEGPFYEIINFSDCEGIINAEKSKKLYEDFSLNLDKAELYFDSWDITIYKNFMYAFELASNNGYVEFC